MTPRTHSFWRSRSSRGDCERRGAVLIITLVCLLIVTAILGSLLQRTLRASRQLHAERDRRQTDLLLQAGADRAAFRLATEPAYRGETWNLPAASILGTGEGRVTIEASRNSDQQLWQISVLAEYPLGNDSSIRRSRTLNSPSLTIKVQE